MRLAKGAAILSLIWGAVAGCGGDPPPRPSVESFCDAVCAGILRCGANTTYQGCYGACTSDPGNGSLLSIRPASAEIASACLSQLDCPTILNGPYDACWQRAADQTAPSGRLIDFCPAFSKHEFECGYWLPVDACESELAIRTDNFLDSLAACEQKATCDDSDACVQAHFGGGS